MRRLVLLGCLLCLGAGACGAPPGTVERLGSKASPVYGGQFAGDKYPFEGVVVTNNGLTGCSGFAITRDLFVTALHCVVDVSKYQFTCDPTAPFQEQPATTFVPSSQNDWIQFNISAVDSPPWGSQLVSMAGAVAKVKKVFAAQSPNLCFDDIAILLLDRPLPPYVKPPQIRWDKSQLLQPGTPIVSVGNGGIDSRPHYMEGPNMKAGIIVARGPFLMTKSPWTLRDIVPAGGLLTNTGVCTGDSGSALVSDTGVVLGCASGVGQLDASRNRVTSSQEFDPQCAGASAYSLYSDLAYHYSLIEAADKESKYVPWLEGRQKPSNLGGPCQADEDCNTRLCVTQSGQKTGVCAQTCDTSTCPSGYDCVPRDNASSVCLAPLPVATTSGSTGGSDPQTGCSMRAPRRDSGAPPGLAVLLTLAALAISRRLGPNDSKEG